MDSFENLQHGRDLWLDDRRKNRWIESPYNEVKKEGFLTRLLGFRGLQQKPEAK